MQKPSPCKEKVLEWLRKTGFPLEMQAASAFREAGFDVRQSYTFPDPQSEKGREIDVLAEDPDWRGITDIYFVIECKSSTNPWVVLTSEDATPNYSRLHAFAVTSEAAKNLLIARSPNYGQLTPYIKRGTHGGYGFRQALKDNDPAYTAAIEALKASRGLTRDRESSSIPRFAFAFPVIVIDSPLFECSLTADGELQLVEVKQSEFIFSAHIPEYVGCCIKVVTKEHLPAFAQWAKGLAGSIRKELANDEESIIPTRGDTETS